MISSFPTFLLTVTLNTFIKWPSAIGAFLFTSIFDFLEGIACLHHGMTFSSAAAVFAEHLRSIASEFGAVGNLTVMN